MSVLKTFFLILSLAIYSNSAQASSGSYVVGGGSPKTTGTGTKTGAIMILNIQGTVEISDSKGIRLSPEEIEIGQKIPIGSKIKTTQYSQISILFANGSIIHLDPYTEIVISKYQQENYNPMNYKVSDLVAEPSTSTMKIKLNYGDLIKKTRKLNSSSSCEIETPLGSAGIRGTHVKISVRGATVKVLLLDGKVDFNDKMDRTHSIPHNKEWTLQHKDPVAWPKVQIAAAKPEEIQDIQQITVMAESATKGTLLKELMNSPAPNPSVMADLPVLNIRSLEDIQLIFKPLSPKEITIGDKKTKEFKNKITGPFSLSQYEVTQEQYKKIMGSNPSRFQGDDQLPVENVTWEDANNFCKRLTQIERNAKRLKSNMEYRLPTEAEWEHACRAGSRTRYFFSNMHEGFEDYAWCKQNSLSITHPVGQKEPNKFGLYDIYGNVFEWCLDWYAEYPSGSQTDYKGPDEGTYKVQRGGNFVVAPDQVGSSIRAGNKPDYKDGGIGFRIALAPIL